MWRRCVSQVFVALAVISLGDTTTWACREYVTCNDCIHRPSCSWCMKQDKCLSNVDIATMRELCHLPVFSPSARVAANQYTMSCNGTRKLLPTTYNNSGIVDIVSPQAWSASSATIVPKFALNINPDLASFSVNLSFCYNVLGAHLGEPTVVTQRCAEFHTLASKEHFLPIKLPYIGAYLVTAWIQSSNTKERLTKPEISAFSRWPARMLESMVIFSTHNKTYLYPEGWLLMPSLRLVNSKTSASTAFLPKYVQGPKFIPKIIHQIWTGGEAELKHFETELSPEDKRQHFFKWTNTWKQNHPDWTYYLWDLWNMRHFVLLHYPVFISTYDALSTDIKRTDFFRILVLFHMGGVYIDIDFESLHRMDDIFFGNNTSKSHDLYLAEHVHNYHKFEVPNAWMASIPSHPLWWMFLVEMSRRHKITPNGYITDMTGPHAFSETIEVFQKWFSPNIFTFKPSVFYPVIPLNKSSMGLDFACIKRDDCMRLYSKSIGVHHYAATWIPFSGTKKHVFHEHMNLACQAEANEDESAMVQNLHLAYKTCSSSCTVQPLNVPTKENPNRVCDLANSLNEFSSKPDRKYLEQVLLPAIARKQPKTIVSFGVALYALVIEHQIKKHSPLTRFITIDFKKSAAVFGSTEKHVVGEAQDLGMFLGNEEADVVIMNGVFGWRDDGSHVDETKKVMQAVYKVMKTDGILILGRNYRHYEGFAFTNIIPMFAPFQIRNDLPTRRSFSRFDKRIDHFYDTLAKQRLINKVGTRASHAASGTIGTLDALKGSLCDKNHLMVVLSGLDAVVRGGDSILRGGCWVVAILTRIDYKEQAETWAAIVRRAGARLIWFNQNNGCDESVPIFRSSSETMANLKNLIQDVPWSTVLTHGANGDRGDPRKVWIHDIVKKLAQQSISVFTEKQQTGESQIRKFSLGYGGNIGKQHFEMLLDMEATRSNPCSEEFYRAQNDNILRENLYGGNFVSFGETSARI